MINVFSYQIWNIKFFCFVFYPFSFVPKNHLILNDTWFSNIYLPVKLWSFKMISMIIWVKTLKWNRESHLFKDLSSTLWECKLNFFQFWLWLFKLNILKFKFSFWSFWFLFVLTHSLLLTEWKVINQVSHFITLRLTTCEFSMNFSLKFFFLWYDLWFIFV